MVEDHTTLLVADSFRVRANPVTGEAEVRGLDRHIDRFKWAAHKAWCGEHKPSRAEKAAHARAKRDALARVPERVRKNTSLLVFVPPDWNEREQNALDAIESFITESLRDIATYGPGWPRLELWQDTGSPEPRLALQLRAMPELTETIELRTAGHIKTQHSDVKGPNIARYAALNRELGCEALLLDKKGHVIEGATTSLIWWPTHTEGAAAEPCEFGADAVGCYVENESRVRSVTEMLIIEAGGRRLHCTKPNRRRLGQPQPNRITTPNLAQHEVWAVNALHGIRTVSSIDGTVLPKPDARRLKWFREALDRTWQPVLPPESQRTVEHRRS